MVPYVAPTNKFTYTHYAINNQLTGIIGYTGIDAKIRTRLRKLSEIKSSSRAILFMDSITRSTYSTNYVYEIAFRHGGTDKRIVGSTTNIPPWRSNVGYLDGHVENKTYNELRQTPDESGGTGSEGALRTGFYYQTTGIEMH